MHRPSRLLATCLSLALYGCGGGSPAPAPAPPASTAAVLSQHPIALGDGKTLGTPTWADGATASGGHGNPVQNVTCLVTEDYHLHAHLSLFQDGKQLAVPAHIGLQGCAYELHTHDASGIIHIETSSARQFTLGQFFGVWGQPLRTDNVAGITTAPIRVWIDDGNGLEEFRGDPATIELTAHRAITITAGTLPAEIPSFTWTSGL
jgi:hypothetical protein